MAVLGLDRLVHSSAVATDSEVTVPVPGACAAAPSPLDA